MRKEYEVPVWFKVTASHPNEAWEVVSRLLHGAEQHDQLAEYIIEEPKPMLRVEYLQKVEA